MTKRVKPIKIELKKKEKTEMTDSISLRTRNKLGSYH